MKTIDNTKTGSPSASKQVAGTQLSNCHLIPCTKNLDGRGSFTEIYQNHWGFSLDPLQWSLVESNTNAFRGLHIHRRHDEYFFLVTGHCYVGLMDLDRESSTFMQSAMFELFGEDSAALIFPRYYLHGWYFDTPSTHIQAVSESYKDYYADDNIGVRWDDPDLDLPWPFDSPTLSARAKNFGTLKSLISSL